MTASVTVSPSLHSLSEPQQGQVAGAGTTTRSRGTDNPIFTGALGMYNGVVLHESTRVPKGQNSTSAVEVASTRRAVLCGAQAVTMAFGQGNTANKFSRAEELFDYGNQLGVAAGAIFGMKKTQFNSADFGTVVVASYAAAHTS